MRGNTEQQQTSTATDLQHTAGLQGENSFDCIVYPYPHLLCWNVLTGIATGQHIPAEEMRIWVDDAVKRILSLQPSRVLEIGCGTGLLLFRIAPHSLRYWGPDF